MNKLIIIAAIGKSNELGKENDLIWKFKGDMRFFKNNTIGHHILMGKNTYYSLPKLLPERKHIVLSTKENNLPDDVIVIKSIAEFNELVKDINDKIYVIGGASIYDLMLPFADEMLLTHINAECIDADVYFPKFKDEEWDKELLEINKENDIEYSHVLYKRKNKEHL